ncbi:hypothetical protein EZV62_018330 [Acer yangbiense]|uniref:Uncharacterized protein n=1 Tax=Acer yangbiense TaxID=1000413 RepID=A0A5C7HJ31_9ROSI|nr:hypothetical protein EZV62_018330 [Acer yangbiense]
MSISPSLSSRQCSDRYAFRTGRNLPNKEFRYLRTVIVMVAVHRDFGLQLPCHQHYIAVGLVGLNRRGLPSAARIVTTNHLIRDNIVTVMEILKKVFTPVDHLRHIVLFGFMESRISAKPNSLNHNAKEIGLYPVDRGKTIRNQIKEIVVLTSK